MLSDGVVDESGKNSGYNVFDRHKQRVQELRHRTSSMGFDAGVCLFDTLWQKFRRGTNSLHHTNEYEDAIVHWKKAQRKSRQMEQHGAKSGKSQRWTNNLDGLRARTESSGSSQIHHC